MRPTMSEFSYGFALTKELLDAPGKEVKAAPVFPSLIAEGQVGGGYDVDLNKPGIPWFLQFKLCDHMVASHCKEAQSNLLSVPCYRMHLRSSRVSRQHELLLRLEQDCRVAQNGQQVYYVAPRFHRVEELDDAFVQGEVLARSVLIRPSEIGPLDDDPGHCVSFAPQGHPWVRFSKPKHIEVMGHFDAVAEDLQRLLRVRGRSNVKDELEALAATVQEIAEESKDRGWKYRSRRVGRDSVNLRSALQRTSYYASVFLGAQLYVVQWK